MPDVQAADTAAEVDERVPVDVRDRGALATLGDDRQVHGERVGDDALLAGEHLAGARARDLRLKADSAGRGHALRLTTAPAWAAREAAGALRAAIPARCRRRRRSRA